MLKQIVGVSVLMLTFPQGVNAAERPSSSQNTRSEEYRLLRSSVTYWFDCNGKPEDSKMWDKIYNALTKRVYGETEFERRRDEKKAEIRFSGMDGKLFGMRAVVAFPEYDFNNKSYDFSGNLDCWKRARGGVENGSMRFPLVHLKTEKAEKISLLNKGGYGQEIIFKVGIQSEAQFRNEVQKLIREFGPALGPIPTRQPHITILGAKINIKGYGFVYSDGL